MDIQNSFMDITKWFFISKSNFWYRKVNYGYPYGHYVREWKQHSNQATVCMASMPLPSGIWTAHKSWGLGDYHDSNMTWWILERICSVVKTSCRHARVSSWNMNTYESGNHMDFVQNAVFTQSTEDKMKWI